MWVNKEQHFAMRDRIDKLEAYDQRCKEALGKIVRRLDKLEHEQNTMTVSVVDEAGEFIEEQAIGYFPKHRHTEVGMDSVIRGIADHLKLNLEVTQATAPELRVWDRKPRKAK